MARDAGGYYTVRWLRNFENNGVVSQAHLTFFDPMDYIAHHTPLPVEFFRQECCSGLRFPSTRDLPDPEMERKSPTLHSDSLKSDLF